MGAIQGGLVGAAGSVASGTVDGARPSDTAMDRIEVPVTTAREISSRSASVSTDFERCRLAGRMPPVSARMRWIDE
jgi:hypothetical protein